jgi:uncharacterized membrane protein
MGRREGAVGIGFVVGAAVALGFAVVISLLPASVFLETGWRAVAYLVVALAAPPTVWFLQWVAKVARRDSATVVTWGILGAITFDGLAIGFVPGLYGQTGDALAWAASTLLFAFATVLIAAQLMHAASSSEQEQPATAV